MSSCISLQFKTPFTIRNPKFTIPSSNLLSLNPKCPWRFHGGSTQISCLRYRPLSVVAAQSNFFKVVQTVWRVGKDGIDAGTKLVPVSIPRPIARIGVGVVAMSVALFLLKSVLSTALFVLAMMGLIYFLFIAFNSDEGPRGGGGTPTTSEEESLEEARRIMEKYK